MSGGRTDLRAALIDALRAEILPALEATIEAAVDRVLDDLVSGGVNSGPETENAADTPEGVCTVLELAKSAGVRDRTIQRVFREASIDRSSARKGERVTRDQAEELLRFCQSHGATRVRQDVALALRRVLEAGKPDNARHLHQMPDNGRHPRHRAPERV